MSEVVVRTRVRGAAAAAFRRFTAEVDGWWKRGPRFRFDPQGREGKLAFEEGEGGRFLERFGDDDVLEVGRVLTWEPPRLFAFRLHPPAPGGGSGTRVEVRFESTDDGFTRVTLTHSGLDTVPTGGRMRALRSTSLRNALSTWWADLLRGAAPRVV